MPFTVASLNAAADVLGGLADFVSLHTADPGLTGANEATGAPYARKPITFSAATGGIATGPQTTVDVAAGTYTHAGYWTALTGGTFVGGSALSAAKSDTAAFQVKVTPTIPLTS